MSTFTRVILFNGNFGQHMAIQPWRASACRNAREFAPEPYPASIPSCTKPEGGWSRMKARTSVANARSSGVKAKSTSAHRRTSTRPSFRT